MDELKGTLFNIQRFSIHDGPGIRTTVFFKGCPNHCSWCHNPESWSFRPDLMFYEEKCRLCGKCMTVCSNSVHCFRDAVHRVDHSACKGCGKCVEFCPYSALEIAGKVYTVSKVMDIVSRDKLFYGDQGGITFSGGEPLAQIDFALDLAKKIHKAGFDLCIETSASLPWVNLEIMLPYVSMFLFDIKDTDAIRLKTYTGISLKTVEDNLTRLCEKEKPIILRCPVIPGINNREDHLQNIAKLTQIGQSIREIHLEPYHPMGIGKAKRIGKKQEYDNTAFLHVQSVIQWKNILESRTTIPIKII